MPLQRASASQRDDQKRSLAMTDTENAPIACTLNPGEYEARLASIAALNHDALLSHARNDLELRLSYSANAAERVREMVRQERECCAFLAFALDEGPEETRLTITVPERARDAADLMFAQFLQPADTGVACHGH
jgi:hypothetical protein